MSVLSLFLFPSSSLSVFNLFPLGFILIIREAVSDGGTRVVDLRSAQVGPAADCPLSPVER